MNDGKFAAMVAMITVVFASLALVAVLIVLNGPPA